MKISRRVFALTSLAAVLLAACSPQESGKSASGAKREVSVQLVAEKAKGFTVGAMMSTATVYVFFDTQCPHCGHLWEASAPLHKRVKFVWIPIGMINPSSTSQGAALLTAANPLALMTEHEASLLAGKGGIGASSSIPSEIAYAIKANTQLFNSFGAESVPFVVAKNARSGQTVSREGAMDSAMLADFIGLDSAP
ncbi:MAG: DsbC family protein [Burkholderiales bacterium]